MSESQSCYFHPDRRGGVVCQRCDKRICPSCMHQASVGFHCPDCLKAGKQKVYTATSLQADPIVTKVLIGINVAVFVAQVINAGNQTGIGTFSARLDMRTGAVGFLDEYYRLITAGFLHYGILHLALNMYALWILGGLLERRFGPVAMFGVYISSILGGSAGVALLDPESASLGASGGVFGLMAMMFVATKALGGNPFQSRIGGILLFNLIITFGLPGISVGGHLGGLAVGAVAGYAMVEMRQRKRPMNQLIATAAGFILLFFAVGLLLSERYATTFF